MKPLQQLVDEELALKDAEIARLTALLTPVVPSVVPFVPDLGNRLLERNFEIFPSNTDGFTEQQKAPGRATAVIVGGKTAVRLHTEPGDTNVENSGTSERCDIALTQALTNGYAGQEDWWHHEIWLPEDFSIPTWHMYVLFDFHHTGPSGGANFHVQNVGGQLGFQGYGGPTINGGSYGAQVMPFVKNRWIEFDYHVKWSSGTDGFMDAWVDRKRKLTHKGPTLYEGLGCYLKLACYSTPVCDPYPACVGGPDHKATSVIHTAVRRGRTWQSVANGPLEGL